MSARLCHRPGDFVDGGRQYQIVEHIKSGGMGTVYKVFAHLRFAGLATTTPISVCYDGFRFGNITFNFECYSLLFN